MTREAHAVMKRVGRRNKRHIFVPTVLSRSVKWKHGTEKWIEQFHVVCDEKNTPIMDGKV